MQGDVTVTQADVAFARKMADEFLPDMDTPSLDARYGSLLAVIKNGISYGRRTALADAQGEPVAWMYTNGSTEHKIPYLTMKRDGPFAALADTIETPLYAHSAGSPSAEVVEALREALEECRDQLWHLAKDPNNNPWIKQANAALASYRSNP